MIEVMAHPTISLSLMTEVLESGGCLFLSPTLSSSDGRVL
jgi:hypothetical protein